MYSLILSAFVIYEKLLVWYVFYHTGSLTNSDIYYFDRVNLLSVGESQKIPCYELDQIVFS